MTLLYYARYSFVLLRPKIEVKLSTQSADKWISMGEMACTMQGDFISQASERPQMVRYFQGLRILPMPSLKKVEQESSSRGEAKK